MVWSPLLYKLVPATEPGTGRYRHHLDQLDSPGMHQLATSSPPFLSNQGKLTGHNRALAM